MQWWTLYTKHTMITHNQTAAWQAVADTEFESDGPQLICWYVAGDTSVFVCLFSPLRLNFIQ